MVVNGENSPDPAQILEEGQGKSECCTAFPGVRIIDTDDQVGESSCPDGTFDHTPAPGDPDIADPVSPGHHIGQGIGRASDAPDMLDDIVTVPFHPDNSHCGGRMQADGDLAPPHAGALPKKGPVALHFLDNASRKGVVVPAECGACSAETFMVNPDPVTIDRREDLLAGALGKRRKRCIPGR